MTRSSDNFDIMTTVSPGGCNNEIFIFVTYCHFSVGFQIRTRQMVNKGGDESSCGALDEIRSCRLESCYSWKIRDDGPCKLSDVGAGCGVGARRRIIECIRWDGVSYRDFERVIWPNVIEYDISNLILS